MENTFLGTLNVRIAVISSLLVMMSASSFFLAAQTPVTTWHYDNSRSGANTTETLLSPANVNYQTFGQLFSQPVDGMVVGHPLYLPNVTIPGKGVHNVVYVATMHDSVWAFDADDSRLGPLWMTSLLNYSAPGATTMSATLKGNANTTGWSELGIVSTPVIDPSTATMYVVAETYENGGVVHRLHALDVTTGLETLGGPVTIAANSQQNNTTTTFQDFYQMNRPALLLSNGHVYIAWGSNCCNTLPAQGWVMSYNATSLQLEGAFTTEPGNNLASIWQKGAGISADDDGNVYAEDGEGFYAPGTNLSTSVIKLELEDSGFELMDWFTPYEHQYLTKDDLDLTGGVLLLPDQPGPIPHEAIGVGKQGTIYVLNRDNMGQLCTTCTTTDTQIVQELTSAVPQSGSPVYWNNTVYFFGLGGPAVAYPLNNGLLGTPLYSSLNGAGANAILTANGNTSGILWFVDGNHNLWGWDAGTLNVLYSSGQAPNHRDAMPAMVHFAGPIAADGKVFVGTVNSLVVFGILPAMTMVSGNGQSAAVGSTLANPLQVQVLDPVTQNPIAGVAVTFSDGGKGGVVNPASAVTDGNGMAATSYTLPTKAGTFTVTASAHGYASLPFTETASAKTSSSTTLQSSVNPVTVGQPVTFTATVSSGAGSIPDGETVTFMSGTTVLGTGTLASGVTTFTTSTLPPGSNPVKASYPGDGTYAASSASLSQSVKYTSTTMVSSSSNPAPVGQSVTFTATVSSNGGSISDGETVQFKNGSTVMGTATTTSGMATFATSTLPTGTSKIVAFYVGDAFNRNSSASLSEKLTNGINTSMTLQASINPVTVGQPVTFTATVTASSGSVPNGETINFTSGATVLGSGTLAGGVATLTISTLPVGSDRVSASYSGDTSYAAASASLSESVKYTSTTSVSSSMNPAPVGQSVTFTATVSSNGGSIPDGETVQFKNGSTVLGTGATSGGVATFTTSSLAAGTYKIVAFYVGDANNRNSYGNVSQTMQ